MRSRILVLGLLLAGCGAPDSLFTPPAGDPAPVLVWLDGRVADSMTGAALADVGIFGGESTVASDIDGRFRVPVRTGMVTLRATASGYEHFSSVFNVVTSGSHDLLLRRLAPALLACGLQGDTLTGIVVDLQGRKTIDRREGSFAVLTTGGSALTAINWYWQPVDYLTWRIAIPLNGSPATDALLVLRDTDGWLSGRACAGLPAPDPERDGTLALRAEESPT